MPDCSDPGRAAEKDAVGQREWERQQEEKRRRKEEQEKEEQEEAEHLRRLCAKYGDVSDFAHLLF